MGRRKKKKKLAQILPDLIKVYQYFRLDIQKKSGLIASSFGALLAAVVFRLLEPWPLKFVLDRVFESDANPEAASITLPESWTVNTVIIVVAVAVVLIAAARAAMDYISKVGFFKVGNFVVIRVRDRVYRHLQNLPMSFHDRARHGDLITRVIRDVNLLRDVTATALLPLLGSFMVLIGMVVVMAWLNWKLAMLSLAIIPLYWLTTVKLGRQIRETARKQRERESAMASLASEAISNIRTIKALGQEEKFANDFDRKNNQSQTDDLKASRLSLRLGRTVDILLAIATAAVLWLGAHYVLGGGMYPGDLVVFLVYLKRSFKPAQEFAKYTARIAKATAAGERVIGLLEQSAETDVPTPVHLKSIRGGIEFRKVNFGYDDQQLVLKDFDLRIPPDSTVAITGPSGAGKSTLIGLLLRFYQPQSGTITLGGTDIRRVTIRSLRAQYCAVMQNPLLFAGTIRENISLGITESVPQKEVVSAARLAEVDEFVLQMPQGYDTLIGERSTTLSRGQRQRIAIARAALSANPILLLDEPLTGLDENNQAIVSDALVELSQHKTTLVVTHNLQLASRLDQIVYVDDGEVKEMGSHDKLMANRGPYWKMFVQQESRPTGKVSDEI